MMYFITQVKKKNLRFFTVKHSIGLDFEIYTHNSKEISLHIDDVETIDTWII